MNSITNATLKYRVVNGAIILGPTDPLSPYAQLGQLFKFLVEIGQPCDQGYVERVVEGVQCLELIRAPAEENLRELVNAIDSFRDVTGALKLDAQSEAHREAFRKLDLSVVGHPAFFRYFRRHVLASFSGECT